jgi:hypothetical protein
MLKEIGVDRQTRREADGDAPELRKSYLEEFNPLNARLYDKKDFDLGRNRVTSQIARG